jgi:hypothetical protein
VNPLPEIIQQQDGLLLEIHERLLVPHQHTVTEYNAEVVKHRIKIDQDDEEKREKRHEQLEKSEKQYRELFAIEERVICSLVTQINHIIAAEIVNRKASRVLCDYKNVIITIPIRYKYAM